MIPLLIGLSVALISGEVGSAELGELLGDAQSALARILGCVVAGIVRDEQLETRLIDMMRDPERSVRIASAIGLAIKPQATALSDPQLYEFWRQFFVVFDDHIDLGYRSRLLGTSEGHLAITRGAEHAAAFSMGRPMLPVDRYFSLVGRVSGPEAIRAAVRCFLGSHDPIEQQAILELLPPSVPDVFSALETAYRSSPHPGLRGCIMSQLGSSRHPEGNELLLEAAQSDANADVREAAVRALARSGSPDVVSPLRVLYTVEESYQVKTAILWAWSRTEDPEALLAIGEVLRSTAEPAELRAHTLTMLASTPRRMTQEKVALIRESLSDPDPVVRVAAVRATPAFDAPWISEQLVSLADADPSADVRAAAIALLRPSTNSPSQQPPR